MYYQLVSELKKRRLPFLVLAPHDSIPLNIKVVLTSEDEKHYLDFPNVLIHHISSNPSLVIDRACQMLSRKQKYDNLVIGIDPGKTFEIAIIGDRTILETKKIMGENEAVSEILNRLLRYESFRKIIKIGDGAEPYRSKLIKRLNQTIPLTIIIESVGEQGTTKNINRLERPSHNKISSAVMIASRKGNRIERI
ncbi:MAG: hypothetical protein JSV76_02270 [Candidatus Bathyarchaeota archaeon]|nr:MAG: hypothetical protein JSV76_02270 [Candidatus Bathyarchaeota archaeon]